MIRWAAASFSMVGLLLGLALFCLSLTPSLLPRGVAVQGILSGMVFAAGYGIGWTGHRLWRFMELRDLTGRPARIVTRILLVVSLGLGGLTLSRMTVWQNSVRIRMEMELIESAYPAEVVLIALLTAVVVVLLVRFLLAGASRLVRLVNRYLPRRVAAVLGSVLFGLLLLSFVDGVILKKTLHGMDQSFAAVDRLLDDEYPVPADDRASGSRNSLIAWDDIGRNGKRFVADGPTEEEIAGLLGREAKRPIRVYAGFHTGETLVERAAIALEELKRVGGFERAVLVIASATGTGWLDPSAVDPVEFLHAGDIATVSLQYSYLPSWLTLMVEPEASTQAAQALFDAVYGHWTTLPRDERPELYLYGLSLGALGSEASADLITMVGDPVNGALWSGPPFPSTSWKAATRNRAPGSPEWRPVFRDSAAIRFMTQEGFPDLPEAEWGPMRIVYLQHASDPMTWFSTDLAWSEPGWLGAERGRDVSPYLRWFPVVTSFQVAFDVPNSTNVPLGYGHNFAPAEYIKAWVEVMQPEGWSAADSARLEEHFSDFDPNPL